MQKLTPNHSKHDCDVKRNHMTCKNSLQTAVNTIVTSQAVKLRKGEICREYSREKLRQ